MFQTVLTALMVTACYRVAEGIINMTILKIKNRKENKDE